MSIRNHFRNTARLAPAAAALAAAVVVATPAPAFVGDGYQVGGTPVLTTWYGAANPAAMQADRDYVAGMRPHHAGALTMAQEYLADPEARSPALRALAIAIIRNQTYEIELLNEVGRNLTLPARVLDLGLFQVRLQPMATEGMGQSRQFIKSPIPGPLAALSAPGARVSERDVQFAKGMTIHHAAALTMARDYQTNAAARNGFLGLLNVEIVTDQTQEIALMRSVIAAYSGDADAVEVPASMIHGMEGMPGHNHAAPMRREAQAAHPPGHAASAAPSTRATATPPAPARPRAPRAAATRPAQPAHGQEDHSGHDHGAHAPAR